MKIYPNIILVLVTFLGLLLRLFWLGSVPISLNRDEVGLGYDAFSLLHTGRDQFGKFLPLVLRSSDDYKPAIYAYLSIPAIKVFGLTSFAVRLPSVIIGTLTVLVLYFLTNKSIQSTTSFNSKFNKHVALLASFVLAISPWHIQYSRGAYEVNAGLLFFSLTIVCLYFSLTSPRWSLIAGSFAGIGALTYHSLRFMLPAILLYFFLFFRRRLSQKLTALFMVPFGLFLVLAFPHLVSRQEQIRFEVLNLFITDNTINHKLWQESAYAIERDVAFYGAESGRIVHNRRLATFQYENFRQFIYNAYLHLSPQFILLGELHGSREKNHAPNYGLMHSWEYILFWFGCFIFFRFMLSRRSILLLVWLIAGLIPAAMSWDSPNSWRSFAVLPPITIVTAISLGFLLKISQERGRIFHVITSSIFSTIVVYSLFTYLHQYFVHLNRESSEAWRYGRREAVMIAESIKNQYKRVIISTSLDDPHLYFLFHLAYDPQTYLVEGGTVSGGWTATQNRVGKYEFKPINYDKEAKEAGNLLIGVPDEFPTYVFPVKTIYYPDGNPAIKMVAT